MKDLWYNNAVIYSLEKTFKDAAGDGIGDFGGLISKLDYLAGLGVTLTMKLNWLLMVTDGLNVVNIKK